MYQVVTKSAEWGVKVARHPAAKKAAAAVTAIVVERVLRKGTEEADFQFARRASLRTDKRLAKTLASQHQGFYSTKPLVVLGEERFVVWDAERLPVAVFPALSPGPNGDEVKLEELRELERVPHSMMTRA